MPNYVQFDVFLDVEASLRSMNACAAKLELSPLYWKGILVNCHAALQGACTCILTGTHGGGALKEGSEKELIKYQNRESDIAVSDEQESEQLESLPYPDEILQNLPQMLRRLPAELRVEVPRDCLELKKCEHQLPMELYRLHEFRTIFSHFPVGRWSIETRGLSRITNTALQHLRLIVESDNYKNRNRFCDTQVAAQLDLANQILS